MKRVNSFLKSIVIIALLLSFSKSAFSFLEKSPKWTFLIYMQADNNLFDYAKLDLIEMQYANQNPDIEIIVRLDTPGDNEIVDYKIIHSTEVYFEEASEVKNINLSDLSMVELARYNEVFFKTQSENLTNFLLKYQNKNKLVFILWGHGEGFASDQFAQFGGVAIDDYPYKSKLSLVDIKDSLEEIKKLRGRKLELMIMDACLMQNLESAYEVKNLVSNYTASSQIQNFKGLPYTTLLNYISNDLSIDANESDSLSEYYLAKKIPEIYLESLQVSETQTETMSSINSDELANVFLPQFNKLLKKINNYIDENPFEKISFKLMIASLPFFLGNSKDLSTFLIAVSEYFFSRDDEIYSEVNETLLTLNMAILNYAYGEQYLDVNNYKYYRGNFRAFGIWLPATSDEYNARINDFSRSSIFKSQTIPQWRDFLKNLYDTSLFIF